MPIGGVPFQDCPQTAPADHPVSRNGEQEHEANPGHGVAERTVSPGLIATVNEQPDRDTHAVVSPAGPPVLGTATMTTSHCQGVVAY